MAEDEPSNAAKGVTINWTPSNVPAHANVATVFSGVDGFLVGFTALVPRFGESGETPSILDARPVANIHMGPEVYFGLVSTMVDSWNKYRQSHAADAPRLELQIHSND